MSTKPADCTWPAAALAVVMLLVLIYMLVAEWNNHNGYPLGVVL